MEDKDHRPKWYARGEDENCWFGLNDIYKDATYHILMDLENKYTQWRGSIHSVNADSCKEELSMSL